MLVLGSPLTLELFRVQRPTHLPQGHFGQIDIPVSRHGANAHVGSEHLGPLFAEQPIEEQLGFCRMRCALNQAGTLDGRFNSGSVASMTSSTGMPAVTCCRMAVS